MSILQGDIRCVEGTSYRHAPSHDDPYGEINLGRCPECGGKGCEAVHRSAAEETVGQKIRTEHWSKPISTRGFDWCAWLDGDDDGLQGYGRSESEAIDDLVALWEDSQS